MNIKRLVVLLIRPSKYHSDGYLLQLLRGSLPSNSLAVMNSLTEAAFNGPLADIARKEVYVYDELVCDGRVQVSQLMKRHAREGTVVVAGLVGVQTNMFPRACDLAKEFTRAGAVVVMGGFHVSGSITMLHDKQHPVGSCPHEAQPSDCELMPPECAEIMREGVIIFHGEAENLWPAVLADICRGTPKSLYRGGRPDLAKAPPPSYPPNYFNGFFGKLRTMDSGRGCPFDCSFCTIINVQGHDMRFRTLDAIKAWIRSACAVDGRTFWFFTDDNFCRNPCWEDILLACSNLQAEGLQFSFMIQSDLAAWRLKGKKTGRRFVELLAEAGCSQVFLGVESVRQDTLQHTGKPQNRVETYQHMVDLYHSAGIACHASFIIGFPGDTPATVAEDVRTLKNIGFDQASFYMLCPLPGSQDHMQMQAAKKWMDPDFNRYDSFQPAMRHPLMSAQQWQEAYDNAWREFYTTEHLVSVLSRVNPGNYWGAMRTFLWYRWSALREGVHPMLGGFYRRRCRQDRRPGLEKESRLEFWTSELHRHIRYVISLAREYYFFQDVYFQTRWMPTIRKRTAHVADVHRRLRIARFVMRVRVRTYSASIQRSTWFGRTFGRAAHRNWLDSFWREYARLKWRLVLPHKFHWHARMLSCVLAECCYWVRFNAALFRAKL
ncbi:MAG: radical SAM protein [Candidatus Doudnabacteria bacterium]|nr:radical SAM protein [Candidatus Doudnabacteria bacterium]